MKFAIKTRQMIYETISSAKKLIESLEKYSEDITELDLSLNTFKPDVFKEIAPIIKKMTNLHTVRFESVFDSLDYEEMCSVCCQICSVMPPTILVFEMPSNAISCKFPDELGEFISRCSLVKLDLYNCGLGEEGLIRLGGYLEKLENKNTLQELNIGKNRINRVHEEIGAIISKFPNLTTLRICHNTIHEGIDRILKQLPTIEILDISDNFIDDETELNRLVRRSEIRELYIKDIKTEKMTEIIKNLIDAGEEELGDFPGKKELILDISQNDCEQDLVDLLIQLTGKYKISKLIIYDNYFEEVEKLKEIVEGDGGIVISEDPLFAEEIETDELIGRIQNL